MGGGGGVVCGFFFFFQAEDGIRDHCVTGVQTCALPIFLGCIAYALIGKLVYFFCVAKFSTSMLKRGKWIQPITTGPE